MHAPDRSHFWAIVLAGGEGNRLRHLTTAADGRAVPKQFCLFGGRTLLAAALERAHTQAPQARVVAAVTAAHSEYWHPDLAALPSENVVVQPANRGTGLGILLPLLTIARRDPEAVVSVLPSDHFVAREPVLRHALRDAGEQARRDRTSLWFLGATPQAAEDGLGWITPASHDRRLCEILGFVEKPDAATLAAAVRHGALINTFLFASTAKAALDLYALAAPELLRETIAALDENRVEALYEAAPTLDFSRDVMTPAVSAGRLKVVRVPPCGWSDLGTPDRLAAAARRLRGHAASFRSAWAATFTGRIRPDLSGLAQLLPARTPTA